MDSSISNRINCNLEEETMVHLRRRIEALAARGRHLTPPNGWVKVEICLSGNREGPFERRLNWALLAATSGGKLQLFHDLVGLWHASRFEPKSSPKKMEAEQFFGPTLCGCCCGQRAEMVTATITADGCQLRVWHGLPHDIGPTSARGGKKPIFSVFHHDPAEVSPYVSYMMYILGLELGDNRRLQEVELDNGTRLLLCVRMEA